MDQPRRVLILETDPAALTQMRRVLETLDTSILEAGDLASASEVAGQLVREGTPPDVIVSRATLPDGSGLKAFDELSEFFPEARQVLVSHYPKRLLFTLPGFADRRAEFLQAAFTDEDFRKVMERSLARARTA